MKNNKSIFFSLLLLNVLLLTSATNAFANSEHSLDLGSRKGEFFKADQNKKAILWEESLSESYSQTSSENENNFFQFCSNFEVDVQISVPFSENHLTSKFRPDSRSILEIQIFPFHFFW